jgi:hypothetical protein
MQPFDEILDLCFLPWTHAAERRSEPHRKEVSLMNPTLLDLARLRAVELQQDADRRTLARLAKPNRPTATRLRAIRQRITRLSRRGLAPAA